MSSQQEMIFESNEEQQAKRIKEEHHEEEQELDLAALDTEELIQLFQETKKQTEEAEKGTEKSIKAILELEKVKEEVVRRTDQYIEEAEKERKLSERYRKETEEHRKRREEAEKRLEELTRLRQGTYYATFDQVWDPCTIPFVCAEDYDAMIRDEFPAYETRDAAMKFPFRETLEKANDSGFDAATMMTTNAKSSKSSHSTYESNNAISLVDLLQSNFDNRNDTTMFLLPSTGSCTLLPESIPGKRVTAGNEAEGESDQVQQAANHDTSNVFEQAKAPCCSRVVHLVPASSDFASLYYHVAIWVFGGTTRNCEPSVVQKLIHGSIPRPLSDCENDGTVLQQQREIGTGLKHMHCNKIRHSALREYLHKDPCLIIVPLLSLQQAKEWKGQGYHAIFMTSTGHCQKGRGHNLQDVAPSLHFLDLGEVANKQEIALAAKLLTATIKGLAYSLLERSDVTENWVLALNDRSRNKLSEHRRCSTIVNGQESILVPKERPNNDRPVRKVTFAPALGPVEPGGHPAPDPLLLTVKAAINWSAFHQQGLMVSGGDDDDDSDSEMSELSILAMEEHLAMVEHYERARRDEEITNMTIEFS